MIDVQASGEKRRFVTKGVSDHYFYASHQASDFYHHYKEDITLMGELGLKAYRMSIAWTRIFPSGDEERPNENGLKFYDNVFNELRKHNIEPLVTISHYESPYYLALQGGWSNRTMIDYYLRFCEVIMNRYKDKVTYWMTFNEINCALVPFGIMTACGVAMEFTDSRNTDELRYQCLHHQFVASAKATLLAKKSIQILKLDV